MLYYGVFLNLSNQPVDALNDWLPFSEWNLKALVRIAFPVTRIPADLFSLNQNINFSSISLLRTGLPGPGNLDLFLVSVSMAFLFWHHSRARFLSTLKNLAAECFPFSSTNLITFSLKEKLYLCLALFFILRFHFK